MKNMESQDVILKIRLSQEKTVEESFYQTQTIADVIKRISEKYDISNFTLISSMKSLNKESESKTLKELDLYPKASLSVRIEGVPSHQPAQQTAPSTAQDKGYISSIAEYAWSWITWSFGIGAYSQPQLGNDDNTGYHGGGSKVHHVSSVSEYNNLKNTNNLVIVDVSAVWCGPCKKIAPYFDQLSNQHPSVVFIHVDLDKFKNTISDISDVRSVPTFKFFKNKRLVTETKGANRDSLLSALNQHK